jgi:hypothetical protein
MIPPIKDMAEAVRMMSSGLGRAELEFVTSITAPLYWVVRAGAGAVEARNGSAFFLDAGQGVFGVTACHVIQGWRHDRDAGNVLALQLGLNLPLDLEGKNAIIAEDPDLDIATFRIAEAEVRSIGKTVLRGFQKSWPPGPPELGRGITHCGFPGVVRQWLSPSEISFGAAPGGGIATSINERDISTLIERDCMVDVLGIGLPPENFDFRGISGGPMLTIVETPVIRSWALAGVIYEGPNPSPEADQAIAGLEIIKSRRAHFILPDGQLDLARWQTLQAY